MKQDWSTKKQVNLGAKLSELDSSNEPLYAMVHNSTPVNCYLMNGVRLSGTVIWADQDIIVLRDDRDQMLFRHGIASICPQTGGTFFI